MKDLKKLYGVYLRSSILVSLAIVISGFIFIPKVEVEPYTGNIINDSLLIEVFPPVDNPSRPQPPRPSRPQPPVGDSDANTDSVVVTIEPTDINDHIPLPYDHDPIEIVPYYTAQIMPSPIYTPAPVYPSLAQQAGIEGTCTIEAVIDTNGVVQKVKVYKSSGNSLLDDAALVAFRTYRFSPAYARDRTVAVWIRMPVGFKLN